MPDLTPPSPVTAAAASPAPARGWQRLWPIGRIARSVRGRLIGLVLLTTAIALLVAGSAMLTRDLGAYRRSWASDLATQAAILASSTVPALEFDDHDAAERTLRALEERPEVRVAALYGADGELYALYRKSAADPAPERAPEAGAPRIAGERVEVTRALMLGDDLLGTLYLRARYDVAGRVRAYLSIFAVVILLSMSVAFVLARRLQRIVTEPLGAMAAVARGIVERRDYSLRARRSTDDEIGVVVDAFNGMLEQVQWHAQALEESNRAMRKADQRKDEFLATLAHELRNPLAPIQHAIRILDLKASDPHQKRWAQEIIARQTRRMALLLDDLLEVSRITSGRLTLRLATAGLDALVATAIETARPLIESKQHTLSVELPPEPIRLQVDALRLSQALSNLLTNAAKYTDPGGSIRLEVQRGASGLDLTVTDNGIGIEPIAIADVFQMFSQVASAIDRAEGGLGIGLALVKGVVELHGGQVSAYSAGLGRGSRFRIHLPESVIRQHEPNPESPPPPSRPNPLTARVLIVDDNVDAAQSLALALRLSGFETLVAHSGLEALAIGTAQRPHVIILDIGMQGLNGYETARRIRHEPWGTVLLIALTGWGQEQDKLRAVQAGFDIHLTKPVDPAVLEELIREALLAWPAPRGASPAPKLPVHP